MNNNKITKGTIVRTIMLALVIINYVLKQIGYDVINVNESDVGQFVEMVISVATIITCYWKNNSITPKAIEADNFMKSLGNDDKE
jgi:SPP1 family holin